MPGDRGPGIGCTAAGADLAGELVMVVVLGLMMVLGLVVEGAVKRGAGGSSIAGRRYVGGV